MSPPVLILVSRPVVGMSDGRTDGDDGFRLADAGAPQLSVFDLGVTRGDGVFETVLVEGGRATDVDAHLARFARSAHQVDLPEPDRTVWRDAVAAAVAAHPPVGSLSVKLVLTRGIEGTGVPTGWVTAREAPDFAALRVEGVRAIVLDRGYRHDAPATSPWLLLGAKTLSYQVNAAALREAARRGAEEVVFTSSDGFVLEAPTSSVLIREGGHISTPSAELGIVPGTTQRRAFEFFRDEGFETEAVRLRTSSLLRADAIWLVSSVRQAVPVTALDGEPLTVDAPLTARLNRFLSGR